MQFTNGTTREPLFHESYESWTCIYTVSLSNDIPFTNCTTRKPLFDVRVVPSRLKCSVTNDMHVTIDPRPVQPVNHCFTTCTDRMSRTCRVKPFTGRIRSTVLDKDARKGAYTEENGALLQ